MMIAVKKQIYRASFIAIFRTLWFPIAPGTPPADTRPAAHHCDYVHCWLTADLLHSQFPIGLPLFTHCSLTVTTLISE